jgi:hypothetical protein
VSAAGFRPYSEPTFARRPVQCAFDPEAPDFGAEATQGRDVTPTPQLQCMVYSDDGATARLLTMDGQGWVLRESVPLQVVEAWLAEAQAFLRVEPPTALTVRATDSLWRATHPKPSPPVPDVVVTLTGNLPFDLQLELDGEHFGGRGGLPWSAAAMTILSRWPPGVLGRVRFAAVDVLVDDEPAEGLLRLYARSLAMRRLNSHIEALTRT